MNVDTTTAKLGYDRIETRICRSRVGPPTTRAAFGRAGLVGWDSPATQFRRFTPLETWSACVSFELESLPLTAHPDYTRINNHTGVDEATDSEPTGDGTLARRKSERFMCRPRVVRRRRDSGASPPELSWTEPTGARIPTTCSNWRSRSRARSTPRGPLGWSRRWSTTTTRSDGPRRGRSGSSPR